MNLKKDISGDIEKERVSVLYGLEFLRNCRRISRKCLPSGSWGTK